MKIRKSSNKEVIIGAEKEMNFSIDVDNSIVFEILRSKMYSDKIGAIVREIACNARDAHREAGIDKPVEISIIHSVLGAEASKIIFKDYGLGISPDRMENIFISYTSSTKRDDDIQTGGFGLGSKTPFAYTDTFFITTVYEGVMYEYTAIIDESNKGKMILLNSKSTSKPSGTEIIIPIKEEDITEFGKAIDKYLKYWSDNEVQVSGWDRYKLKGAYETDSYILTSFIGNPEILVDGIPYKIPESIIDEISDFYKGVVVYKLKVSDVTLSTNRESVQNDEITRSSILKAFGNFREDLINKYEEFINCKDIKELREKWDMIAGNKVSIFNFVTRATTSFVRERLYINKQLLLNGKTPSFIQDSKALAHVKHVYEDCTFDFDDCILSSKPIIIRDGDKNITKRVREALLKKHEYDFFQAIIPKHNDDKCIHKIEKLLKQWGYESTRLSEIKLPPIKRNVTKSESKVKKVLITVLTFHNKVAKTERLDDCDRFTKDKVDNTYVMVCKNVRGSNVENQIYRLGKLFLKYSKKKMNIIFVSETNYNKHLSQYPLFETFFTKEVNDWLITQQKRYDFHNLPEIVIKSDVLRSMFDESWTIRPKIQSEVWVYYKEFKTENLATKRLMEIYEHYPLLKDYVRSNNYEFAYGKDDNLKQTILKNIAEYVEIVDYYSNGESHHD